MIFRSQKIIRWYFLLHGIPCLVINKNLLFWTFWSWEIRFFLSQKSDGKMIFTDYWKALPLNFLEMRNTVLFSAKKSMEKWYLLITEKFLFWTFWRWEIRSFEQKANEKMIFTWSFWVFHDIPGLGKYGFSCSVKT